MEEKIKQFNNIINNSDSILVVAHIDPDGDAIGSGLAMYNYLKNKNKNVKFYSKKVPNNLYFIPNYHEIIIEESKLKKNYDLVIVLDCSDINRMECNLSEIKYDKMLVIDHHITHISFGDLEIVDPNASATCEILFELFNYNKLINTDIAICLYTGIVTDTGCFKYTNVTANTMSVAKELIEYNINFPKIIHIAFDTMTIKKFNLTKMCLNKIELLNNRIAYLYLNKNELDEYDEDNISEGIVNYGRNIEGIEVSILIKQTEEKEYKVSLRSNEYVDVSKIALELGGGGHIHAAGITIKDTNDVNELKKILLEKIYEQIQE